ncbi:MAG: hypothetical protein JST39_18495, partial [Bacteroidetes bacterium]|nr:hypothetical protein [Bacteroidota bacterium]
MKHLLAGLFIAFSCTACHSRPERVVDPQFADSLMMHYSTPSAVKANAGELAFWSARIDPKNPGIVNESKYAAALITRFHLLGDIKDVHSSDSLLLQADSVFNHHEAGPLLAMVGHSILGHRFTQADSFLQKAKLAGIKPYDALSAAFDVDIELGRYSNAALMLRSMKPANDYGYYFRRSRMDHINGATDSSIAAMLHAATLADNNNSAQLTALSNAADLYVHIGEMEKATRLYTQCLHANSADMHSLGGLGWITLMYDKNDSLAERIFHFVQEHNALPDTWLKLSYVAAARGDSTAQKAYAVR